MMDNSELAMLMLQWEADKKRLIELENRIKTAVLAIAKTQFVGNVRATYSAGRKTYDYQGAGQVADPAIITSYTKVQTSSITDWRLVCQIAGISAPFTQSDPTVTLKLEDSHV